MSEKSPLTGSGYDHDDGSKKKRNIIIVGVILFLIVAVAITVTLVVVLKKKHETESLRQRLNGISNNLGELSKGVENFWNARGLDTEYSGFYGTLNREGESIQPDTKSLLQQSQHLWSYATLSQLKDSTTNREYLNKLYIFLTESFYQRGIDYGQFYYLVNRFGNETLNDRFELYAEAYTILGIAKYYDVTQDEHSFEYFDELQEDIDRSAHDPVYGGYNTSYDRFGNPFPTTSKDTFTHLALMEAFTEQLVVDYADDELKARLGEIISIFLNNLTQQENYFRQLSTYSWGPSTVTTQNYGLDLEAIWALRAATKILDSNAVTDDFVKRIGGAASSRGFDSEKGGYFFEGNPDGQVTNKDKVYWVQASSLLGNWELYTITKDNTYLDRIEKTISWIQNDQVDKDYGEWYERVDANGTVVDIKGSHYKSSFHNIRATLWLKSFIDEYAEEL